MLKTWNIGVGCIDQLNNVLHLWNGMYSFQGQIQDFVRGGSFLRQLMTKMWKHTLKKHICKKYLSEPFFFSKNRVNSVKALFSMPWIIYSSLYIYTINLYISPYMVTIVFFLNVQFVLNFEGVHPNPLNSMNQPMVSGYCTFSEMFLDQTEHSLVHWLVVGADCCPM